MNMDFTFMPDTLTLNEEFAGYLKEIADIIARHYDVPDNAELSVTFTDDKHIQQFNRKYRQKDEPTDVLAFAFNEADTLDLPPDAPYSIGEIIISLETVDKHAKEHSFQHELNHVFTHGFLHLLGIDHQNDLQAAQMKRETYFVLRKFYCDD